MIVEEGLSDQNFVKERCEDESFKIWLNFIKDPKNSPESMESETGIPADLLKKSS